MELALPIFLFAFAAAITPGPNNIMIMASGLNFGTIRSLPHLLGICIGFPVLHEVIKVICMALLLVISIIPVAMEFIE